MKKSKNMFNLLKTIQFIIIIISIASCNSTNYKSVNNSDNSLRIISLVPSVTKELVTLGMIENIVGATSYCDITATNKNLIVSSAIDVNIEKVLLLKPDIVFASSLIKQKDITTLQNNNIKVHMLGKMYSFNEICKHFIEIGKIVGKDDVANTIVDRSKQRVDSIINTIPSHSDSLKVFFQIGTQPIFSVIKNTYMDDFITFAGCKNIMDDLNHGTVTRESILHRNPDIILISIMGIAGNNEINVWNSYPELNAVKNNNVFVINSVLATSPTVLSFVKTFEDVVNCVYH